MEDKEDVKRLRENGMWFVSVRPWQLIRGGEVVQLIQEP